MFVNYYRHHTSPQINFTGWLRKTMAGSIVTESNVDFQKLASSCKTLSEIYYHRLHLCGSYKVMRMFKNGGTVLDSMSEQSLNFMTRVAGTNVNFHELVSP